MSDRLPHPAVAPETYTERYFLESCAGYESWAQSDGSVLDARYAGTLRLAGLAAGEVVVDIGCGRGELLAAAIQAGAQRAVGVEYAPAAIELARRTLATHGVEDRASVLQADARALPLPDAGADLVTMLDVVEHLTPAELDSALREALRVLRPGGRIFVHTLPNRLIYDVTYRLQRLSRRSRRRDWPRQPRHRYELEMHVNEHSVGSLRRALRRAGFDAVDVRTGAWIHDGFVPDPAARALYRRLAAHRLTAQLGAADIWGRGRRGADGRGGAPPA